jgi:ribosomal protein L7Ae-like RNA K-turn-binding protein
MRASATVPARTEPLRRALGLLGLAARAGMLVCGTAQVRDAVRDGRIRLALVATDAAANARDKLVPLLEARGVRTSESFERDTLGAAVGRAPLSAIGITDASLAARIETLLSAGETASAVVAREHS